MNKKTTKDFFSFFSGFIQKSQITIINASIAVILITVFVLVLLSRASSLQRDTSEESFINLTGQIENEVQAYYFAYFDLCRTVSGVFQNYDAIDAGKRRDFLNDTMKGILSSHRNLLSVYTILKPDVLDARDAYYANTPGTDETGQFISGFTRERTSMEQRAFPEFRSILDRGGAVPVNTKITVSEPFPIGGIGAWAINFQTPIIVDNEFIGIFGLTVNLDSFQDRIAMMTPLGAGQAMVCNNNETVIAHNIPELQGSKLADAMSALQFSSEESYYRAYSAIVSVLTYQEPSFLKIEGLLYIISPLRESNSLLSSSSLAHDNYGVVITAIPESTILAPINELVLISIFFIIGTGILVVCALIFSTRGLIQRARVLQRDLERATALQDNLKYGLFMIDKEYVIQDIYSKALEKIMVVSNLQGRNFVDLLSSSLKYNEKQGFTDYLEMIFNNTFDREMLDNINPINIFTYQSKETGERKELRTNFAPADGEKGIEYLLVTLEDITAEKKLEKQLKDSENLREKEMQSIFQVIQLNPRVVADFIEDAEYEFDKINEMLKNKTQFHRDVLVEIYQSIHAVKSNALILNLDTFSNLLHSLETSIKRLQEKFEDFVPFDDFLSLVLEINEVMEAKDELKTAISKIQDFKVLSGDTKSQDRYVLVETLTQVCNKTQALLNKQVKLVVDVIDDEVLNSGPRRVIKEVLSQLVRNAVYHGIETPDERTPLGKDPEGEVHVSIQQKDDQILIKVSDNGKGINFEKVRQTAETYNLLNNPDDAEDNNFLLQLIFSPGFSTLETADLHAGRGIGLNLVKDRVQELNGTLKVSSLPGKGTTFTIVLPLKLPVPA